MLENDCSFITTHAGLKIQGGGVVSRNRGGSQVGARVEGVRSNQSAVCELNDARQHDNRPDTRPPA